MRPPQRGSAKLSNRLQLNDKYTHFFFEMVEPHEVIFEAGQYVSVQVSPRGDRRPYSICNDPSSTHSFELLVDLTPKGLGTTYIGSLELGQEIGILAPMGVFVLADNAEEKAVNFIATGSGIAPFRSMILDLLINKRDTREITLYWGLRHEKLLFWQDEFLNLAELHPNFHFHPVISQPTPEWPLCQGRVTDCLATHPQAEAAGYYLCGNTKMVEQVMAMLSAKNVPASRIHHEKFF